MKLEDKECWLRVVGQDIQQATAAACNSENAVRQIAVSLDPKDDVRLIWDAQERSYQTNGRLKSLKAFLEELEQAGPMDTVGKGAQLRVSLDGDEEVNVLVMCTKVDLQGTQVVTPKSPMIQAIWRQLMGFSVIYQAPVGSKQVTILEIH